MLLTGCSLAWEKPVTPINPNGRNDAWGFTGYGGGGAMFNPAVSPFNPDFALVACDMTGSFATTNGGQSWRMFCLRGPVRYFVFDPVDSNTVYAKSIALFKSSDHGNTWNVVYPPASEISGIVAKGDHAEERIITRDSTLRNVLALAVDPSNSDKLYAAISINDETGFYTSADRGISWNRERDLDSSVRNIFVNPASPENDRSLYITCKNYILARENAAWKSNPAPAGVNMITGFTGGYDSKGNKFVIYGISGQSYFNPGGDASGIFYTEDGGRKWENRQAGMLAFQKGVSGFPEWRSIATGINHPEEVYVSYGGLQVSEDTICLGVAVSEDFGKTWKLAWKDCLSQGGYEYSPNYKGGWIDKRFGPTWGENPFAMAVSPSDPGVCYSTDFGRTIRTTDGGKRWEQLYTKRKDGAGWVSTGLEVTTGYEIITDPFNKNHIFIANTDVGLMESHDRGASWMSATVNNGIPRKWMNSTYWLAFDPHVRGRAWAAMSNVHDLPRPKMWRRRGVSDYTGGLVMTEDDGKSWKPVSNSIGEAAVTHILVDPSGNNGAGILYACAFGKGVYKSSDEGRSWTVKNNGIEGKEPFAWRITLNEKHHELFLVVCRRSDDGSIGNQNDGAVYRSSDGAESWTKMNLPSGTNGPMSIMTDPQKRGHILMSAWGRISPGQFAPDTGGGIFLSTDNGSTWTNVLDTDQHIHDITYDHRNGTFYACGFNGSAYRSGDRGRSWSRIRGYNFKWGKRVVPDPFDPALVYIVTFGGGVWHGPAKGDVQAAEDIVTPVFSRNE